MSLFQSLFGKSGSDKADRLRQQAIDAFNSIKTPALADLQVQLNDYVNQGIITPEQAEASLLGSNAFDSIATDPSNTAAQKLALTQLQQIGSQGGMTAIDKAQMNDISDEQNQQNRSQNEATMQQARQRGVGGSGVSQVNQLINEQGNADRAARSGTQVAANAQARALQAIMQAGQLGGQMQAQEYGEQANKANAQNAIQQFNAQTQTANNQYNTAAANNAQAANVANAQNVANMNTQTQNANKQYNAQQNQTVFNDNLAKANGVAGTYNNWANDASQAAAKDQAANVGLTSGLIGAGATTLAGPAGGALFSTMTPSGSQSAPAGYDPKMAANQSARLGYADGGIVPNQDKDEISLSDAEGFKQFMEGFAPKKKNAIPINFNNEGNTWDVTTASNTPGGSYQSYIEAAMQADKLKELGMNNKMSDGGMCIKNGGKVPGKAPVAGDSPKNDIVPANLSPDEAVIKRTTTMENPRTVNALLSGEKVDEKLSALRNLQKKVR